MGTCPICSEVIGSDKDKFGEIDWNIQIRASYSKVFLFNRQWELLRVFEHGNIFRKTNLPVCKG